MSFLRFPAIRSSQSVLRYRLCPLPEGCFHSDGCDFSSLSIVAYRVTLDAKSGWVARRDCGKRLYRPALSLSRPEWKKVDFSPPRPRRLPLALVDAREPSMTLTVATRHRSLRTGAAPLSRACRWRTSTGSLCKSSRYRGYVAACGARGDRETARDRPPSLARRVTWFGKSGTFAGRFGWALGPRSGVPSSCLFVKEMGFIFTGEAGPGGRYIAFLWFPGRDHSRLEITDRARFYGAPSAA